MGPEAARQDDMAWGGRVTAKGVDFLVSWVEKNVPSSPVTGDVLIRALAQKLRDDASAAGFSIADLEIDGPQVEPFIRETMGHVTEPGTVGD
jgi:hypothetical protein